MNLGRPQTGLPPLRERVVYDGFTRCPYLPGQIARLPLRLPSRPYRAAEFAERLADGDRRQGVLLYRPHCPRCQACEPIRIDVREFAPNKTQRRVFRRGELAMETRIGHPVVTAERVALYNRHKIERDLVIGGDLIDTDGYEQFLVDTCTDSFELSYRHAGRLVGVAIADRSADALSAVYCFFDPSAGPLSPGTYSILKQVELCRIWGLRYLYLGLYVAGSPSMLYKARFLPHERLIDGTWQRFARG